MREWIPPFPHWSLAPKLTATDQCTARGYVSPTTVNSAAETTRPNACAFDAARTSQQARSAGAGSTAAKNVASRKRTALEQRTPPVLSPAVTAIRTAPAGTVGRATTSTRTPGTSAATCASRTTATDLPMDTVSADHIFGRPRNPARSLGRRVSSRVAIGQAERMDFASAT